jgi:hypothetical protein
MLLVILATIVLVLHLSRQKEPFSLEFKTSLDGKAVKAVHLGASQLINHLKTQTKAVPQQIVSFLPFKDKIRQWQRQWRRKNM